MGIRLKGEAILSSQSHDILSEGILPGSIQVPSDGQPIVLMRDIPCTGGYPKIAILNEEDISKISQLPPGSQITFDLQTIY
jgi:allophanate hydrolase subunit 2